MNDIMQMDRQINYRKWSLAHNQIDDEDLEDVEAEPVAAYKGMF